MRSTSRRCATGWSGKGLRWSDAGIATKGHRGHESGGNPKSRPGPDDAKREHHRNREWTQMQAN